MMHYEMTMPGSSGADDADNSANQIKNNADEGVDLIVKGKSTWNVVQNEAAAAKATALTESNTVVTNNPVARQSNLRSKFIKAGGKLLSGQHVDHIVDLQLGGTNDLYNLQGLNGSVNTSFGKQINNQVKILPDATRVNRVTFIPHIKK
jgi:hypothetical protein